MHLPLELTTAMLATAPGPATFWLPESASTIAGETDFMFNVITWICYFFFALVTVLLVVFAWKYRQRTKHSEFTQGPTHHTPLEVTWTIIPLIIVIVIFFMGFKGFLNFATPPREHLRHRRHRGEVALDLQVPQRRDLGRPLRPRRAARCGSSCGPRTCSTACSFRSSASSSDVVPGRYNQVWFQSDNPTGEDLEAAYDLFCTEYCGTGHSNMNRKVYVLEQTAFDEWVTEQGQWLDAIPDEELYYKAGPKLFAPCANCHSARRQPQHRADLAGPVGTDPQRDDRVHRRHAARRPHRYRPGVRDARAVPPRLDPTTPAGTS